MTPIHRETLEFVLSAAGLLFLMAWFAAAIVNALQEVGERLSGSGHDEDEA